MGDIKFQFGLDFQETILNYVIGDSKGYKAIELIEDSYFVSINHAVIFKALSKFWKLKHRIPSLPILKEKLRLLYESREFNKLISEDNKKEIESTINRLYNNTPKDSDEILDSIIKFARFTALKDLQESQNLLDFNSYDNYSNRVQQVITLGSDMVEDFGSLLVAGAKDRVYERGMGMTVTQTPFWQINRLLNGGGFEKHSLILLMSEAKRFKTGMMINWALKELGKRRKGFIVDLENGQMAIATRGDQSMIRATKSEILSGLMDDSLLKLYRKYKRVNSELAIKRFPSYKTTTASIGQWLQKLKLELGLEFDYGIVDYADLMGSLSGRSEDDKRISDVYLDLKNLAKEYDLDYIITASHVNREASKSKRNETKFYPEDVAKAIDKIRHCDAIFGLQENPAETEAGVMRLEIIEQRDGVRDGNALFWVDIEKQHLKEFTKAEVTEYRVQMEDNSDVAPKKRGRKSDI